MSVNNIIAAFEGAIKAETELYTSRLMKQFSNYCGIVGAASGSPDNHNIKKMQEDIEYLSKGLDYVMNMLISKDKHENNEVSCSPYEYDSEVEEIHVNKLQPHEIKEIRIETEIPSAPNPTPMMIPVEADIIPAPISISKSESMSSSVVPDDTEVETEGAVGVEEEVQAYVGVEGAVEVQDEVEDEEQEEEAEEEEEGIDVEEFEYKGTSYYKDPEGNVYECLESGEVGEPVGTMSKKIPGKVLFYS